MYLQHFGLSEPPFSITPDPRFVYLSERHRDGLAHLLYGVGQGGSGGFVQLTGEVGTGKTTLCRLLLEQLPAQTEVALVLNPRLDPVELVETICQELKLDIAALRGSLKGLVEMLNVHLLARHAAGWRVVALIDEAQDLSRDALEQVRLLTNLETAEQKLLQVILIGQPELRDLLERPDLRQLAQRITARYHLTPLNAAETEEYVRHRLTVAGSTRQPFTRLALRALHGFAGGVPRLLNVIADRALLAAYVAGDTHVGERTLRRAAREAMYGEFGGRGQRGWWLAAAATALLVAGVAWSRRAPEPPLAAQSEALPAATNTAAAPTLLRAMTNAAGHADRTWARYLTLWQLPADQHARARRCPERISATLRCLRGSGSLGKLRLMGRPVLVKLNHGQAVLPALLSALEGDRVRLELAGDSVVVGRDELERHWFGDYLAVWQHPDDLPVTVGEGAGPRALAYLGERLQQAGTLAPTVQRRRFDGSIAEAVREVQRRHGLLADGIAGPETWLVLSKYDAAGPHLLKLAASP